MQAQLPLIVMRNNSPSLPHPQAGARQSQSITPQMTSSTQSGVLRANSQFLPSNPELMQHQGSQYLQSSLGRCVSLANKRGH